MRKLVVAVVVLVAASPVLADGAAAKMSKEELLAFLPGTEVVYTTRAGSLHRWNNAPDGKFVASTDNRKYGGATGLHGGTAPGTWRVDDDGKYCVQIDWSRELEKWCAYIIKADDGAYYLNSVDPARRIGFTKK